MRAWSYYALHTFINSIKKIFRSKFLIFFGICMVVGIGVGICFGVFFGEVFDSEDSTESDGASYTEVLPYDLDPDASYVLIYDDAEEPCKPDLDQIYLSDGTDDIYFVDADVNFYAIVEVNDFAQAKGESLADLEEYVFTGEELNPDHFIVCPYEDSLDAMLGENDISSDDINDVIEAAALLLLLVVVLFSAYFGAKKGCDIFLMPDVNFLFPAPIKEQSVLFFRLSFQLAAAIVGCFYLLFQIPNLLSLGLSVGAICFLFGGIIVLILFAKVVNVLSYILCSKNAFVKKNLRYLILGFVLLLALFHYKVYQSQGNDFMATVNLLYGDNYSRWIPVFGWFKGMIGCGVTGDWLPFVIYTVLFLASFVAIFYLTWHIKADFYEEALLGASARDEILQAAQDQNAGVSIQREKDRSDKIKRNTGMKGQGAAMFLHKEMYNRKRMCRFGIISNTMITYFLFALGTACLMKYVVGSESFCVIAVVLGGILFFRSFGNPIAVESTNVWLNLVPENPYKKVFFAMLAGSTACFLDLLPAMIVGLVLLPTFPIEVILWYIFLLLLDFALASTDVMLSAVLPDGLDQLKAGIIMMFRFALAGIYALVISLGAAFLQNLLLGILFGIVISLVCSAISFFIYPMKLEQGF